MSKIHLARADTCAATCAGRRHIATADLNLVDGSLTARFDNACANARTSSFLLCYAIVRTCRRRSRHRAVCDDDLVDRDIPLRDLTRADTGRATIVFGRVHSAAVDIDACRRHRARMLHEPHADTRTTVTAISRHNAAVDRDGADRIITVGIDVGTADAGRLVTSRRVDRATVDLNVATAPTIGRSDSGGIPAARDVQDAGFIARAFNLVDDDLAARLDLDTRMAGIRQRRRPLNCGRAFADQKRKRRTI